MPAVSQAQARFMRAVASGSITKEGLSPRKALEYVKDVPYNSLPKRAPKTK